MIFCLLNYKRQCLSVFEVAIQLGSDTELGIWMLLKIFFVTLAYYSAVTIQTLVQIIYQGFNRYHTNVKLKPLLFEMKITFIYKLKMYSGSRHKNNSSLTFNKFYHIRLTNYKRTKLIKSFVINQVYSKGKK